MPLRTTRNNNFPLDRRLAALAARREQLVEVEVAEEALGLVEAVRSFEALQVVGREIVRGEGDVGAGLAGADAGDALGVFGFGLGIEGDAFKMFAAVVADEAFGVEAAACGGDDAAGDGESTLAAKGAGADGGWGPVGLGASRGVAGDASGAVVRRIGEWAGGAAGAVDVDGWDGRGH